MSVDRGMSKAGSPLPIAKKQVAYVEEIRVDAVQKQENRPRQKAFKQ
jgi:hypothetical protein